MPYIRNGRKGTEPSGEGECEWEREWYQQVGQINDLMHYINNDEYLVAYLYGYINQEYKHKVHRYLFIPASKLLYIMLKQHTV